MSHSAANHNHSAHGSLKSYVIGLILSLVLTGVAFGYVWDLQEMTTTAMVVLTVCAVAQVFVQLVLFLHFTGRKEQTWDIANGLYILISLLILLFLSLWIFHHFRLNTLMVGH